MNCILNMINSEINYNSFCYKKAQENMLEASRCVRDFFSGPVQNHDSPAPSLKGRCREILKVPTLIAKAILLCIPIINRLNQFSSEKIIINLVKQDGKTLKHLSKDLRANKEIVLAAVKKDGKALKHASQALKEDDEVCREAYDAILRSRVFL